MGRGDPPARGIRASVPNRSYASDVVFAPIITASSPVGETPKRLALFNPNGRDSGLSGRVRKTSIGLFSQAAPYTTVWPSGAKRAVQTVPRRNVSRLKEGGPVLLRK